MKKPHLLTIMTLSLLAMACQPHKIIDRPINFDKQRIDLTRQYLKERYGLVREGPEITPRMVVVHWTSIPTADETFAAFNPDTLPGARSGIAGAGNLNVSSQFMVDVDGAIYRLMPENWMARHTIGLNHCAIGIENVGPQENGQLTEAQLATNIWLIRYLKEKYPIEYVIGHYEYTDFEGHPLWLEKDDNYRTEKIDPGEAFMISLRTALGMQGNKLPSRPQ